MRLITILTFLLLSKTALFAQCDTNPSGFGNNSSVTMYNVLGNMQLTYNTNNSVTLSLASNFATAAGPDVRIFLVNRGTLTNAQLKIPAMFMATQKIEMGLSPASGVATFTKNIPTGMTISSFNTVYFYCQAFNQFWDFGSFTPFTTSNCATLATSSYQNNSLAIFPNPVNDVLQINLKAETANFDIKIYTILGNIVYENTDKVSSQEHSINLSNLNSGVYYVKCTDSENNVFVKQFIKK